MKLLDIKMVMELTTLCRNTINKLIAENNFPAAKKLGKRNVWKESEVLEWIEAL